MSWKDDLHKLSESVKQQRDELKLQLHLARQDVRDEWDDMEQYWERFRQKMDEILHDASDAGEEAYRTAHDVGEDLKQGYQRIRDRLKS
ncbi:hypothetical protein [Marinobacter sp. JSM 1782161]|uniref:hypothetical protein n=1 Tax=Marinobacter sp. JSM 1782161 TaxID=2685906 RepID=UPI0014039202|nr:hypothetical protein [Marinobacter sp. JSM 1782161]